ncbi:hypothetical protein BDY21DRAFT_176873 [Lineolata rhizophorae]|uniref:FAR-17a/AIG1-like protein n=1 Tax=Lineolata rhizophorae TaxID=578093 RepID=A0A6A6P7E9_9PEZI|nr:hypothetical protein BDY21DRAFT_176873 [Lineolata rhizophorae]
MSRFLRPQSRDLPFDPEYRFFTSWLLSPVVLFGLRAVIGLYAFIAILYSLGHDSASGNELAAQRSFDYFTNLCYWGLAFYFGFSAAHTGSYAFTGRPWLASWPRFLQVMHAVFYTTIVVFPFLVTIIFWGVLYDGAATHDSHYYWSNVSFHGLNSLFGLLEIALPRTSGLPWWHLIPLTVVLGAYLGLAHLVQATQGFWVYDFLNSTKHKRGIVAAYCVGIFIGMLVVFGVVHLFVKLRRWATENKGLMLGKFAEKDVARREMTESAKETIELREGAGTRQEGEQLV